jgi:small subunit ribosomal protein S2
MNRLPGLLFIIDSKKERIAVSEANKLGVPIVAIVDTNADPDLITVPIAGNDDAIRSVELIAKVISDTIDEARREAPARPSDEEQESYTFSSDRGTEPAGRGERGGRGGDRGGQGGDRGGQGGGAGGGAGNRPRRRRAKPEAIAARLKPGSEGTAAEGSVAESAAPEAAGDAGEAGAESAGQE